MDMRLFAILMVALLAEAPSSPGDEHSLTEQKMTSIENGLVPFTAPMDMLQPGKTGTSELKTLLERMAHYNVPGVSIAVTDSNGIEWAKAYGTIKAGSDIAVTTESLFEAASTSKLIVSAIALHYVEQGLLDLDTDVNTKLKSWSISENSFTEERSVTLRLLLTHQAGLNRPEGGFSWEDGSVPTLLQTLNGVAPAENDPAVIEYEPGSKWQYSNFGYLVIQQLLEDVLGEPFAVIARRTIFEPLGMKSSTFEVPLDAALKAREAVPHDAEGVAHEPEMNPTAVANGGLMTTPTDLALFTNELIHAYRGDSDRILSGQMAREMLSGELDIDPAILGVPLGEGLGVLLFGTGDDFYFLHPGDNLPGATSWLMGCPSSGNGIVVMTNGAMGNLLAMEIVAAIINEYNWPSAHSGAD
jgi:CubicO group peptidase (beta-lactamase class C family)